MRQMRQNIFAPLVSSQGSPASNPSPGPLPLCGMEKMPVAVHPPQRPPKGAREKTHKVWLRPWAALR
jgi:hypothetical protein